MTIEIIRPATMSEVEIVADLSARTFVSAYRALLPDEALADFVASAFSVEKTREEMSDPRNDFLLAFEGRKPVGYAMLREADPLFGVSGESPAELARIYLEEGVVGRGYGSALLTACLDSAIQSGHDILWLGVWEKNERAIRFYERTGFNRIGSLPFEFGDELHTDLLMARVTQ